MAEQNYKAMFGLPQYTAAAFRNIFTCPYWLFISIMEYFANLKERRRIKIFELFFFHINECTQKHKVKWNTFKSALMIN